LFGPISGYSGCRWVFLPIMSTTSTATTKPTDLITRLRIHIGAIRVSELARILTMSRTTLYQMVDDGRIPHYRIGDSIRFDPVRISEWLAEQEIAA